MVSFPEFRKSAPKPTMTVASLDARHRVQRRSVMMAMESLRAVAAPAPDDLCGRLEWEGHLERTAHLRARFYRLRMLQQAERQELIEALTP